MRRILIPTIILAILSASCGRMAGRLSADAAEYDFGVLDDTVTVISHAFLLKNNGPDTCHITRVTKSCGCTSLEVSEYNIPPGGTSSLETSVRIAGFLDHIEKTVTVHYKDADNPLILKLLADIPRGTVAPELSYPYNAGGPARFQAHILFGGQIRHGEKNSASIIVYNDSDRPLNLRLADRLPPHVSLELPGPVAPHKIGRITSTFDFRKVKNIFGEYSHEITLADGRGNRIPIQLLAIAVEAPPEGAAPAFKSPVYTYHILDSEKDDPEIIKNFKIRNEGEADLIIRDISAPEGVEATTTLDVIPPGEEAWLSVTLRGDALTRDTEVNLTTNDPRRPFRSFKIVP